MYRNTRNLQTRNSRPTTQQIQAFIRGINEWAGNETRSHPNNRLNIIVATSRISDCYRDSLPFLNLNNLNLTSLPAEFSSLIQLRQLDIRNNFLAQGLPLEIVSLTNLEIINDGNFNITLNPSHQS